MRRLISFFLTLVVLLSPVFNGYAQTLNTRTQTLGEQQYDPNMSFRRGSGGSRTPSSMNMQPPSIGGVTVGGTSEAGALMSAGYQVHVLGEVSQPGTYIVNASTRLSEAIQRAGGFAQNASERQIELRRKGVGTKNIDILSFKLMGKLDENPYLMDNDVIFVPLRNKTVQIAGAIKRSGMYELKNEKTVSDVVELAGGFNAATSISDPIRIIRFKNGEKTVEKVSIDNQDMRNNVVENGDVIYVPSLLTKDTEFDYDVGAIPGEQPFYPSYEDRVFVLGGVALPGAYPFSPYYSINQYISLAGGINDRGVAKYSVIAIDGKTHNAKANSRVNPGDTIMVKQRWMTPASWIGFVMGMASFGLSTSTTIFALTR